MGASLAELLDTRPPVEFRERLGLLATLAEDLGVRIHVVGGTARDLLLDRPLGDLDLVTEGPVEPIAAALAERLGCPWKRHEAFGTAEVLDPRIRTDLAAARHEVYRAPAALPQVFPATLEQDLSRRDFTVNALAIRLGGDRHGELTDLHGGRADLAAGKLEILHERSFVDDPTRILRGLRFESRLGFRLSERAEVLARAAAREGLFGGLSGARWRHDLVPLLDLERPPWERMAELGVLRSLFRGLDYDGAVPTRMTAAESGVDVVAESGRVPIPSLWRTRLLALASSLPGGARRVLAERLDLDAADRDLVSAGPETARRVGAVLTTADLAPHAVEELLRPLAPEELALVAATGPTALAWVRRGLAELLPLELTIRGSDLVREGAAPGPAIGRALAGTRRARLDGRIGPNEELAHALALLSAETERERR